MTQANEKSIVLLGYPLVCLLAWPFLALRPHCFCSLSSPSEIGHFLWQFPFLFGMCSTRIRIQLLISDFQHHWVLLHEVYFTFQKFFQLQVPERNVKGRRKSATSIETSDMFDPSSGRHENDIEVDNSTCKIRKLHQVQLFD